MNKIAFTFCLATALSIAACSSSPQKTELKEAVAELVQSCKGKVNLSYTEKRGSGETVNASCDNSAR